MAKPGLGRGPWALGLWSIALAACSSPPQESDPVVLVRENVQHTYCLDPAVEFRGAPRGGDSVVEVLVEARQALVDAEELALDDACSAVWARYRNIVEGNAPGFRARRTGGWETNQGSLVRTDRDLDLAWDGDGFFRVRTASGKILYTRKGTMDLDRGGYVVIDGHRLDPEIRVPENITRLFVDTNGSVQGFDPTRSAALTELGQIAAVRIPRPERLASHDGLIFTETEESGSPVEGVPGTGFGLVRQGFLERANFDETPEVCELAADVRRLRRQIVTVEKERRR